MRRLGLPLFAFVLAAATIIWSAAVSAETTAAGVRLRAVSSTVDGARAAVLLEASEPVAYATTRPDPASLLVELRGVASAGFANGFRAASGSPIQSVQVDETRGADGVLVTRVRVGFTRQLTPNVRSQRNLIFIEAETSARRDAAPAAGEVSPETRPADPVPAGPVDPNAATTLRVVEAHAGADGVSVILEGNGRLTPRNVHETGGPNDRVVLDFHGVMPSVPPVTAVDRGVVKRIRVAVNSRDPLVTRVVVDLDSPVPYKIEPLRTDGRRLRLVFQASEPAARAAQAPAADPMAALTQAGPLASAPTPVARATAGSDAPGPEPPKRTAPQPETPSAAAAQPALVQPAVAAAPPVVPRPSAAQDTIGRSREREFTGHPVSLDFQGADLRAVLRTFAEISGLNIVIDPAVQGSVDVALRDVPWDQALDIILRANKLGYFVDGTIVRVAPLSVLADEEKQRRRLTEEQALSGELQVMTKTLSYARAEDVAPLLTKSALSPRGTVQVDPRTNTLIISDLRPQLDTAVALIATLDQPQPQVEIEARIVQTTRDFARTLGVQWGVNGRMTPELGNTTGLAFPNSGVISGRTGGLQGPDATPTGVNLGVGSATSALGLALGAINGSFNLDVALSALEREGYGKLLSTPRVSTQNNVEAEITQGVQIPIQTVANNTVTVTFKDAALTLKVTPQITSANTVIMKITVENASPDFSRAVGESLIPPIDTQRAITQVLVNDGETTVIGGIYVSREQAITDRTPALHRIPLLGWLFKRNAVQDESRELLIFITPRILRS